MRNRSIECNIASVDRSVTLRKVLGMLCRIYVEGGVTECAKQRVRIAYGINKGGVGTVSHGS